MYAAALESVRYPSLCPNMLSLIDIELAREFRSCGDAPQPSALFPAYLSVDVLQRAVDKRLQ